MASDLVIVSFQQFEDKTRIWQRNLLLSNTLKEGIHKFSTFVALDTAYYFSLAMEYWAL